MDNRYFRISKRRMTTVKSKLQFLVLNDIHIKMERLVDPLGQWFGSSHRRIKELNQYIKTLVFSIFLAEDFQVYWWTSMRILGPRCSSQLSSNFCLHYQLVYYELWVITMKKSYIIQDSLWDNNLFEAAKDFLTSL